MKQKIKIALICLARTTFDYEAAKEIYKRIQSELKEIENVEWEIIPNLIIEIQEAKKIAKILHSKNVDALVCISGTFALGHLILEINKELKCPILLWGLNELPYDGGRIRLNSVCGVNLNASNLYKGGVKNFHLVFGDKIDVDWIDAVRIKKALFDAHVGIIGYRAKGFFNLDVDELDLYKEVGVLIDHFELEEIFSYPINENEISYRKKQIESIFDVNAINEEQLLKVARLAGKFDKFMSENELDAIAIRCWPEFANKFGISPCAAMSVLQSEGKILTCEGDILGSLSMIAHKAIGAKTPFLADFSQIDFKDNFGLLWHCGVAACNLWDGKCNRSLDSAFSGGKGVTADFVIKPAEEISLARFDYAPPNDYRIYIQKAKGIPMKKELKGTYAKVKFEKNIEEVIKTLVYNGIAHHISVVLGDYIKPFEIFAKIQGWEIIK
ncbi:MAG: fucose isomerase [Promethearchaeota archaeon]|nr:MAG: fucose isomerase [Candidatus Lokiarchaeota archaeon]